MMMMMVMMMMVLMTMMMMMVKVITLGFASTPSLAIRVLPQVALSMGLSLDSDHLQSLGVSFVIKAASTGCLSDMMMMVMVIMLFSTRRFCSTSCFAVTLHHCLRV